ncbi:YceD family protein [Porticoccus sp.]|uniref:YceD family protein n=1 Tax=Porticoccus sp. TaxID=2024853 RepID=UPI003F6A04F0
MLEPRRLAHQGVAISGELDHAFCDRLAEAVIEITEPIVVELRFDTAEQGRRVMAGSVSTSVLIPCQRCLEAIPMVLSAEFKLGIVWSEEEAKSLPKDLDPWLVDSDVADVVEALEDELLLALPLVSYHPKDQCNAIAGYSTGEGPAEKSGKNPFGILKPLKNSGFNS